MLIDRLESATRCPFDDAVLVRERSGGGVSSWVCPSCRYRGPLMSDIADSISHGRVADDWSRSVLRRQIARAARPAASSTTTFRAPPSTTAPATLRGLVERPSTPPIELFYDTIADDFDALMNRYDMRRRVETIFRVFFRDVNLRGRTLLDAGCGTGWFSAEACRRGARVTAVDIGPRLLAQVRRKCPAETVIGDVLNLQFDDDSFDVVISSECIEHTRRPRRAVQELIRVCRPGGLIAITSNNHFWYWLCALANRYNARPYKGIENWPRWSEMHDWVARENVRILDRRGIHLFPFQVSLLHPLLRFLDRFGRVSGRFCVNQAILAIKQCP